MKIELPPDAPHIHNGTLIIQPIAPSFHSFVPYVTNDTSKIHITHHGESPPTDINWLFIFNTTNTPRTQHGRFSVQYSTAVACSKVEFLHVRNLYSFLFADIYFSQVEFWSVLIGIGGQGKKVKYHLNIIWWINNEETQIIKSIVFYSITTLYMFIMILTKRSLFLFMTLLIAILWFYAFLWFSFSSCLLIYFCKCLNYVVEINVYFLVTIFFFHTGRCRSFRSYKYIPFTHYQSPSNSFNTYSRTYSSSIRIIISSSIRIIGITRWLIVRKRNILVWSKRSTPSSMKPTNSFMVSARGISNTIFFLS